MWRTLLSITLCLAGLPAGARAEVVPCDLPGDRGVTHAEGWVTATQGRDEDAHEVRVKVWGPERVRVGCAHIDADAEQEVLVVSRGIGSGPYYRLQIIDFGDGAISSWSYGSFGAPRAEQGVVFLGRRPDGAPPGPTAAEYLEYRFTDAGLRAVD